MIPVAIDDLYAYCCRYGTRVVPIYAEDLEHWKLAVRRRWVTFVDNEVALTYVAMLCFKGRQ